MEKRNSHLTRLPANLFMTIVFILMGMPFYRWLKLFCAWIGWIFWPVWLILTTALPVSYMLPWKWAQTGMHMAGECSFWGCIYIVIAYYLQAAALLVLRCLNIEVSDEIRIAAGWIAFGVFALCYISGVVNALFVRTVYLTVKGPVSEKVRLVLLSDLHMGAYTTKGMLPRISRAVNETSPDVILIAGDMVDMQLSELRYKKQKQEDLTKLCSIADTYACMGNHDLLVQEPERDEWLRRCGITFLQDEETVIKNIRILGRRDVRDSDRCPVQSMMRPTEDMPLIVLDHNPKSYKENFALGALLVLSGHTHGGQTFPGTIVQKLCMRTPVYGHIEENGQHLVVTSGAGFWGPPLRLGVNNEIWCIDIIPETKQ